jgi:hypothetical protein
MGIFVVDTGLHYPEQIVEEIYILHKSGSHVWIGAAGFWAVEVWTPSWTIFPFWSAVICLFAMSHASMPI